MQGLDARQCLSETYNNTIMATFLRLRRITGFTVVLLKAVHSFKGGFSSVFKSAQPVTWTHRYSLVYTKVYKTVYTTAYSALCSLVFSTV